MPIGLIWSLAFASGALLLIVLIRRRVNRIALRAFHRSHGRIDRFKLKRKAQIRETLLADPDIATAVHEHSAERELPEREIWARVRAYVDEIVPSFNLLTYYRVGLVASRALLNLFYKVSVEYVSERPVDPPRDSIVIYLMNHRSNADYVLVGYALSGRVAISYAVGEWARIFPLEYIFKAFGAYFIRRRFRERLYHTVLERYVQLITRNGVTQGIFLEGGLSRDGKLGKAKIGLLDYMLGVARDPAIRSRLRVVPVAVNYDRVLEDRSLLRELDAREGRRRPPRYVQFGEVARYVWWSLGRVLAGRWKRYGRAAVVIGQPFPVASWIDVQDREVGGGGLFALERTERLARIQQFADLVMERIAALVPVTPVALACAAVQSFDGDFILHDRLIARMREMHDVLSDLNARVIHREGGVEGTFDRAWRMLKMRRVLAKSGGGYVVLTANRPLISYYANSVGHLLGPFAEGVRRRDALPGSYLLDAAPAVSGASERV